MPVISRSKPAFAPPDGPAGHANDSSYSTYWRRAAPAWLAYDLSSVPADIAGRSSSAGTTTRSRPRTTTRSRGVGYNNLGSYTIQVNPAAGGGQPPANGWVTLATVTNNSYHSRTHFVDMTGNNWLRINVTASTAPRENNDAEMNMDVHDASADGASDSWIFYGDSITEDGMPHEPISGSSPNFSQLINTARPAYFPAYEDGGIGGSFGRRRLAHQFVAVDLPRPLRRPGLRDERRERLHEPTGFYNNYVTMVQAVINAGKVPIVPTIPWARTRTSRTAAPALNAKIQQLTRTSRRSSTAPISGSSSLPIRT